MIRFDLSAKLYTSEFSKPKRNVKLIKVSILMVETIDAELKCNVQVDRIRDAAK